ncbi:MAG: Beta-N-acetylhexosaminidase [Actinoallomurus sp.]|nr:Beta-N-acetylhexosaminidase [Actinoallomurus sp.]
MTVWPTPRYVSGRRDGFRLPGTVGIVTAADTDGAALRAVRAVLEKAGVTDVRETAADPRTEVTLWLSGGAPVLKGLGAADHTGLGAEGYVLAAGRYDGRAHVVLDGADEAGSFYAAVTLGRLVRERRMPGVVVRDRPSMLYRGSIEGFYGTPWSHADRLDHFVYLGAHKMNTYEYAPKDDPYHRERWRDPYPPAQLARLGELVGRARDNHVEFTFALSPGLSIRYTSPADLEALLAKFEAVYALGCRSFTVPFDDIDYGVWHCADDENRFGDGGGGAGAAQAFVLNAVQAWARGKGDVRPLQTVPTEYSDLADSPYKRALRERLEPDVIVHWTGAGVIPATITAEQAALAREVFGHPILIWDNYPVNDYIGGRLPLAAYTGREPGLSAEVTGIISNPSNQAAVSKVALFSFADFGWHDGAYDARRAWAAALAERAGGDVRTTAALRAFADVTTYDGTLHRGQAPELAAATNDFWRRWNAGDRPGAVGGLRSRVRALAAAPAEIRADVADPAFAGEAGAWLDATALWAEAMDTALDMLGHGSSARAWDGRRRVDALMTRAGAVRDTREPHRDTAPKIGDGVIDAFLVAAKAIFDRSAGVRARRPAGVTSLTAYRDDVPGRMTDGDSGTYFRSDRPPAAGDWVGVNFGEPHPIGDVAVLMGGIGTTRGQILAGVLEYSGDGVAWTALATGTTAEVRASAPGGATATQVRYRATAGGGGRCVVREFLVSVPGQIGYTVTGGPDGDLAAAADGSLDSAYSASAPPAIGDALVVTASAPERLERVRVLGTAGAAEVEVRAGGTWRHIGVLREGCADLETGGMSVDAVRLAWHRDSPAPSINEVVFAPRE